jgi:5-methylcytosine-specific restriction endonuclease McrA
VPRTMWNFEMVKEFFETKGCTLLSEEYVKAKGKLDYVCECGTVAQITFDKFKQGQRCSICKARKTGGKNKHSYEYIKSYFEENGCQLLTKLYVDNKQKLKYRCECGNDSHIAFAKFQSGQRCDKCRAKKISEKLRGPNASNWDQTRTMEERIKDRRYPEYYEWRRNVFERDDFTCQICGIRGSKLNAHHIQSFAKFPDLRTDVSNGVTLCSSCHSTYHRKIEHNTATTEGWEYFSGDYLEPPFAGEEDENAYIEYLESITRS